MACASSEDSDQPGHPPSLIRVFAVRMKKAWVLSHPLSAQRRLWSDWADAQTDLSLRWVHMPFCRLRHALGQICMGSRKNEFFRRNPSQICSWNLHKDIKTWYLWWSDVKQVWSVLGVCCSDKEMFTIANSNCPEADILAVMNYFCVSFTFLSSFFTFRS